MGRKKKHEDHINHEAWAIPYGDLVTLLLAFFVVMYSISSVNEGKYRVLSDSLVAAFRGKPKSTKPIQIGDNSPSGGSEQGREGALPQGSVDRSVLTLPQETQPGSIAGLNVGPGAGAGNGARGQLENMAEKIRTALADLIERDEVRIRETALWLEVEIKTDVLFPVGVADVSSSALPTLNKLGAILSQMPNSLRVEGHTDDVPITTSRFPSNWELSAGRASSVVRLLQEGGVVPDRMVAVGLGEYRPAADNDTAEGRNRNRRVTIVILATDDTPETFSETLTDTEVTL